MRKKRGKRPRKKTRKKLGKKTKIFLGIFFVLILMLSVFGNKSPEEKANKEEDQYLALSQEDAKSEEESLREEEKESSESLKEDESSTDRSSSKSKEELSEAKPLKQNTDTSVKAHPGKLAVHFIDVGQGDSILIDAEGHYLLIDAGTSDKGGSVVSYLKNQGVTNLDYVITTHPHEDHIGGMTAVLNNFPVENIIMPDVIHTTKSFENLIDSIKSHQIHAIKAKAGNSFHLGNASCLIVGPSYIDQENLNNDSVGLKLVFGENSFLFTGDAEREAENAFSRYDIHADLLKVAHHGSRSSTSPSFLSAVSPSYAVISCGAGNDYGHPHAQVLDRLRGIGADIYRTDISGTIIAYSDGSSITFNVDPANEAGPGRSEEETHERKKTDQKESADSQKKQEIPAANSVNLQEAPFIGNRNSKVFHYANCDSVKKMKEKNKVPFYSREEAINQGYKPCGRCHP